MRRLGITHIVNVGESPNQLSEDDGPFKRVAWLPIEDLVIIPTASAIRCVNAIHECVCDVDSNVYLHCVAGWNRSPTVLWLYLVACGIDKALAKRLIASSSYDAVPGHSKIVDDALVTAVREHGRVNFQPHPRIVALDAGALAEHAIEPKLNPP